MVGRCRFVRASGLAAIVGGVLSLIGTATPMRGVLRPLVPGSIVLLMVGTAGLYVILRHRDARLARMGLVLAGTGLSLGLIGMGGSALKVLNPNPVAQIINTGEHVGLLFIGAGMIVWGFAIVRSSSLGRYSFLPVAMGILSLYGITLLLPARPSQMLDDLVPLMFSICWVILGYAMIVHASAASETSGGAALASQ